MSPQPSRASAVAARLADPATRGGVDIREEIDWEAVVATLVKNKVPLIPLANDPAISESPLLRLKRFQEKVVDEERIWRKYREEYKAVRDRFLARGIPSVLFKSVGLPPSFPYTSDNVDTLVAREHAEAARGALYDLGYVELRNVEEPQKWLFRKFEGGRSVSAIHLHGTVGWGVPFLDDASMWGRIHGSEDDPLVNVPAPEDALLVTIAHAFYEDKCFKLLDIVRARHCLRQKGLNFSEIERIARERGWQDGLAFCVLVLDRVEDWLFGERSIPEEALERARGRVGSSGWLSRRLDETLGRGEVRFPFRVSFLFVKLLYYRKVLTDPTRARGKRLDDLVRTLAWGAKLKLNISGQRGMIVSISGIDGSGKTLHARALAEAFETCAIRARTYWSRFGSLGGPRAAGGVPRDALVASDTASSLARRRRRLRHPLVRLAWLLYNLGGLVLRYNWRVRLRCWLGEVVICDRYVYDAVVEMEASLSDSPGLARLAGRILSGLCPRPEAAWLLDVPADLSVARQGDENRSPSSAEELSRQRSAYLDLAAASGLTVTTTRGRPEESTSLVVRETLRRYFADYRTWVNALLLSNPDQMNPRKGAR
jgi:thymidylate kinase